jgi:proteasome accessory factor A
LVEAVVASSEVEHAAEFPPSTTRARLRGEFIRVATENRRDFSVDWTHLVTPEPHPATVTLLDPFAASNDDAEKLIASLARPGRRVGVVPV